MCFDHRIATLFGNILSLKGSLRKIIFFILVISVFAFPFQEKAYAAFPGYLHGLVMDVFGSTIGGANLYSSLSGYIGSSSINGIFYGMLFPGVHQITVEADGYLSETRTITIEASGYSFESFVLNFDGVPPITPVVVSYGFERSWPLSQIILHEPRDIALGPEGNIYALSTTENTVKKFSPSGEMICKWGKFGNGDGQFQAPSGIDIDADGNVYVADSINDRIQKFDSDGQFLCTWGTTGSSEGQFNFPCGIEVTDSGYVYVADSNNDRVQEFDSTGQFVRAWGSTGSGDGQFDHPWGISVGFDGSVYVADSINNRIQKFDPDGHFCCKWGSFGISNGQFDKPYGIKVDPFGYVYVADKDNHRIQKFDSTGQFLYGWGSQGDNENQFNQPHSIDFDLYGNVYVADAMNNRIQKFNQYGTHIAEWGSKGDGLGEFDSPQGIGLDADGDVYVVDSNNDRVQKFSSEGDFITLWGAPGDGEFEFQEPSGLDIGANGTVYIADTLNHRVQAFNQFGGFVTNWGYWDSGQTEGGREGQFSYPVDVAVSSTGNVYVVDRDNPCIQKFSGDGQFLTMWGQAGDGDGAFSQPSGVAVDASDHVYVVDTGNHRIQKFDEQGTFIKAWGGEGGESGKFDNPKGIAVSSGGTVYVSDCNNHRIQAFTLEGDYVHEYKAYGTEPGCLMQAERLAVGPDGKIYLSDTGNDRVQVLNPGSQDFGRYRKAIVVAGGGFYPGNNIWTSTMYLANRAYTALTYQGFSQDRIKYLSSNTDHPNVDGEATNINLQDAISTWAEDADDLFIYLVDHGGVANFRMNPTEILLAEDLDGWLDGFQNDGTRKTYLVLEACFSGSFIPHLLPPSEEAERFIITTAATDKEAIIGADGDISFSFYYWSHILHGDSFYDAYVNAKNSIDTNSDQFPQIECDGDGQGNNKNDKAKANVIQVFNRIRTAGDPPFINEVSPIQSLPVESQATIYADGVVDSNGIRRVYAVITPPGLTSPVPGEPIVDFPVVELELVQGDRYEGTFDGLDETGEYQVAVFAKDNMDTLSLPKSTSITATSTTKGDLNGDGVVDGEDADMALAVLSGDTSVSVRSDYASSGADVNGDGKVGMEEAVYIQERIHGLRDQ